MGEMKRNEVEYYHVCSLLKDFTRQLYYYEKTDWLDTVFMNLDNVLVCNQYITNAFTAVLRYEMGDDAFYGYYDNGLFPKYLRNFDQDVVKKNIDRINEEIDKIPAMDADKYPKDILLDDLSKFDLLDLRKPYSIIVSILKYYNDPLLDEAEYGYYIGSLLKIKADEWLEKYGETIFIEPDKNILEKRIDTFRKGVFCTLDDVNAEDYDGWHKQHREKKKKKVKI
jgi:hypothetical protein